MTAIRKKDWTEARTCATNYIVNSVPCYEAIMSITLSKLRLLAVAVALFGFSCISLAQAAVTTTYINLGASGNALLRARSPLTGSPRDQIGIFVMHPSSSSITHGFTPCANCPGAPFGDTVKRLFDFVDAWLSEPGRF